MGRNQHFYEEITPKEARGDSPAVSSEQFQNIAAKGERIYNRLGHTLGGLRGGTGGLDKNWEGVKENAYDTVQKSWGGATYSSRSGKAVPDKKGLLPKYSLSARRPDEPTTSLPENVSRDQFSAAMDQARKTYSADLSMRKAHLGVFHDDEKHSIDIDPAVVVRRRDTVNKLGAYTHAVGGAYSFHNRGEDNIGIGAFPPHVKRT